LVLALTLSVSAVAWPGFDWDEWKALTGETRPEVESPQAGLSELLPLLKNEADDPREFPAVVVWKKKQRTVQIRIRDLMVGVPKDIVWDETPVKKLDEEFVGDYVREHVLIPGEDGDPIPAYVLVPKSPASRPLPAMIVLHQTQAAGKAEAVGLTGDPEMAFADELAKRGYLCVVPDAIGFGERIPEGGQPYDGAMDFYKRHPTWSFFGKMSWETSRTVDYLIRRGDVNRERIGVIGHSHGGYGAIMAAAVEPRIGLVVASCGLTTFRSDPNPERWSHLTALMPRLGFFLDDINQTPTDWHEVAALIAPRPFFNWSTLDDKIFPNAQALSEVYEQLGSLYSLYNMEHHFRGELAPGEHRFPKEAREEAYDWIDEQFNIVRK